MMIYNEDKSKIALITRDKTYTYGDFFIKINQYSKIFENKNYSRIAIYAENCEEWIFSFYAGWKNNCTIIPIDFLASSDDASYIINDCNPDLIFYTNTTNEKVDSIKSKITNSPVFLNLNELKIENNSEQIKWSVPYDVEKTAVIIPEFDVLANMDVKNPEIYFKEVVMPDFNKELTSYKRIMKYALIKEEIPRTRLGKIQRFKLIELFEKPVKDKKQVEQLDYEEYHAIKTFLESQVDMTISPDDHLEFDIALDSLGKITLIDFIERTFGVKIQEDSLLKFPSIRQMVEHIRENKLFHKLEIPNWSEILKEKIQLNLPKTWATQTFLIKSFKNIFKVYFKFNKEGLENIPEGAAIITPNHSSYIDGLLVTAFMKRKSIKETYFYAKRKHISNRFLNFMANKNNVIIMDVNTDLKVSIQKMAEVLKQGKKIIIFPEGTRSKTGEIGEFKKTFAILSKELNVPVVPVAISGAYQALPAGARFPRPFTKVNVNFLQAVYPADFTIDSLAVKVQELIVKKL